MADGPSGRDCPAPKWKWKYTDVNHVIHIATHLVVAVIAVALFSQQSLRLCHFEIGLG